MTDLNVQDHGRILTQRLDNGVFTMTLDRPSKRNGITPEMWDGLILAYETLETDASLRVGVLLANGGHFTGGMDLPRWRKERAGESVLLTPADRIDPLGLSGRQCSKPIVIGIEGVCYTVGVELALASDVVVAGASARFSQLEVKRGVIAFGGATIRMVERAGWGNAMSVLLTGDEFTSATALRFGIIQQITNDGSAGSEALRIAQRIALAAPIAVRSTLENCRFALGASRAEAVERIAASMDQLRVTQDADEGAASFSERRAPVFQGR